MRRPTRKRGPTGRDAVPAVPGRRSGWVLAATLLVIAATVLAVHWPVLGAQATAMDDEGFVAFNRLVTHPSWSSTVRFFAEVRRPSTIRGYYTPLSMTSLMLDYARGGRPDDLSVFHQTNLALHVIATLLLVLLLYRMFGSLFAAAAAGLMFGLHPLTVEPVAWVGERKTLLAACLAIATLLAYVAHARTGRLRWRIAAVALFALALLAKPTVVTLPLLLPLLDLWPLRRLSWRSVAATWPFLLLAFASSAITVISHRNTVGLESPDWPRWPLQAAYLVAFYLGKIVWPSHLTPAYQPPGVFGVTNPAVITAVAVVAALAIVAVLLWRRTRAPLVGALVFLFALAPTLGLVKYSWVIASDKYVYFAALGVLPVVAAGLAAAWESPWLRRGANRLLLVLPVLIVLAAEARGVRRTLPIWHDSLTHFRYLASTAPGVAVIHNKLGTLLAAESRSAEAVREFRIALALQPDYAFAHYNLGLVLTDGGALDEAILHLGRAADLLPDHADVIGSLGRALLLAGRPAEAEAQYRRALRVAPDDPGALSALGELLVLGGRAPEGTELLRRALALAPDDAEARFRLAGALLRQAGGAAEAAAHLRQVVGLRPDWPEPMGALAWLLATSPDASVRAPAEALAMARRAVERGGSRSPELLDALAAAEGANGDFAAAAATERQALALAERAGARRLAEGMRGRLARYERGLAYIARD